MAQSKAFADASQALNDLSHALALLESENAKLRKLVQYICNEGYGDDWFTEEAAALGIEGHY